MHGKLLLRISAVTVYFKEDAKAVNPAIEEIGEKIDKTEKTCEKLMILMEKKNNDEFAVDQLKRN